MSVPNSLELKMTIPQGRLKADPMCSCSSTETASQSLPKAPTVFELSCSPIDRQNAAPCPVPNAIGWMDMGQQIDRQT
ncbi:hypothetical protein AVEN_92324-1 [Araneus ventricosus]|uniref:Uncharacterized protein n=1 Tax=Araneus ventricosus TaxID=182803 RepID=A0A4Y2AKZ8_ARAVE|nr:hypothetical protein AVEN_92324-1 [Araneus ventricosus]